MAQIKFYSVGDDPKRVEIVYNTAGIEQTVRVKPSIIPVKTNYQGSQIFFTIGRLTFFVDSYEDVFVDDDACTDIDDVKAKIDILFPDANTGSSGSGDPQDLQEVTDEGNTTTNDVGINGFFLAAGTNFYFNSDTDGKANTDGFVGAITLNKGTGDLNLQVSAASVTGGEAPSYGVIPLTIKPDGGLQFGYYGNGTFDGAAERLLGVDEEGNLVETEVGGGIYSGSGTLPGDVIVDLDGHFLQFGSGQTNIFILDTDGSNQVLAKAFDPTNDGNAARYYGTASTTDAQAYLEASFNDGTKTARIHAYANTDESEIEYTAGTHTFNGITTFATQYTPTGETDNTYPNGTLTQDDSFLYYRTSGGDWVKSAWLPF